MQMKRFFVAMIAVSCAKLCAMDAEKKIACLVQPSVDEKSYVIGVVVQYKPGYTVSKWFEQLPVQEQKKHNQKMIEILSALNNPNGESSGNRIINILYFLSKEDLGLYYVQFAKPTAWALIQGLVKDLPGFEALHDIEAFEKRELGYKERLLQARLALLDLEAKARIEKNEKQEEMRLRKEQDTERRTAQLIAYRGLSSGHKSELNKKSAEALLIATK